MAQVLLLHELADELGLSVQATMELCIKVGLLVSNESSPIIPQLVERVRARAIKDGLGRSSIATEPLFSVGCFAHCPVGWSSQPCPACLAEANANDATASENTLFDSTLFGDPPIRLVVFDLDGTLANTDELPSGYRTPFQVLDPGIEFDQLLPHHHLDAGRSYWKTKDWSFGQNVSSLPARLIEIGYSVAVVTRAPLAYASTLIYLLGISTQTLRTSCGGTAQEKAQVLNEIAEKQGVESAEMLYVGDLEVDKTIAHLAGCRFASASDLHSGQVWAELPLYAPRRQPVLSVNELVDSSNHPSMTPLSSLDDSLKRAVFESIRQGIPDSEFHTSLLFELSVSPTISRHTMAGLAWFSLLTRPGSSLRHEWRTALFAALEPGAGSCLIRKNNGLFQVDPRIITQNEATHHYQSEYLEGLRKCLPGTTTLKVGSISLRAAFKFSGDPDDFGSCLSTAKNYVKSRGSGPHVQLGYVDLIADILASYVDDLDLDPTKTMIVPVPSSPFSPQQVGQVSFRLAFSISKKLGIPIWPVVNKTIAEEFEVAGLLDWRLHYASNQIPREAILIEDQCTTGKSIKSVTKKLQDHGIAVQNAVAYSTSLISKGVLPYQELRTCFFHDIAAELGMKCPCTT
jgi:hypothetical protein